MLQCLVAAVRPLRVEELAEILAFDFGAEGIPKLNPDWRWEDQEEAVMSACSSLVIVFKDGDSRVVQFSHFSVKEFLMSTRLAESSRDVSYYHIPLKLAHTILAQACLGLLLRLDDRIDRDKIKTFPLARYAAEHWDNHARFENVSSYIKDGMECLFDADKPHYATWLWVYNKDRHGRSMVTMVPETPKAVPLYYAALFGLYDLTAHLLAEHPEGIHAKGGFDVTALHASARHGHVDTLSLLLEYFPNLEIMGADDQTPLHIASEEGHLVIGQRLLDRGADINARAICGWTPLYLAAAGGQLDLVRMLLERGAPINASNINRWTPLHIASVNRHVEIVRLLLEHGADPNVCNKDGKTPSDEASRRGLLEIVQVLSKYGTKSIKQ
jgi:ankyrin repeat protein